VIEDPAALIAEFTNLATRNEIGTTPIRIEHELLLAPHRPPPRLPPGSAAVYVFSMNSEATCRAGAGRALKVGIVGSKSAARFTSQHYLPGSSASNLAKSLLSERLLWPFLGIDHLGQDEVKTWMMKHLDRDHFFVDPTANRLERHLERFLRGILGPVFEG